MAVISPSMIKYFFSSSFGIELTVFRLIFFDYSLRHAFELTKVYWVGICYYVGHLVSQFKGIWQRLEDECWA